MFFNVFFHNIVVSFGMQIIEGDRCETTLIIGDDCLLASQSFRHLGDALFVLTNYRTFFL